MTLSVSAGKGITRYGDTALDDAALIGVCVTDVDEVDVGSSELRPARRYWRFARGATNPFLRWNMGDPSGTDSICSANRQDFTRAFTYDTPGTRVFYVGLFYTVKRSQSPGHLSDRVAVTSTEDAS